MRKGGKLEGWKVEKLTDVFEIRPPKKEARDLLSENDFVSFLPMEDLDVFQRDVVAVKEKTLKEVSASYTYFANNDVLLAKITPCFENGKAGIVRNLKNGVGFGSSEYIVFRSKGNIIPEFLFYFFALDEFRKEGKKAMTGAAGQKRVSPKFIESLDFAYPPLPEQQRIVSVLDEAFASIAQAKSNAERNLVNARELFETVLENIFSNSEFSNSTLSDAAEIISGYGFSSRDFSPNNSIKSIKITNVGVREFVEESDNLLPSSFQSEYKKVLVQEADIVIALTRSVIANGLKVAIVPQSYDKSLLNQRVAALRAKNDIVLNSFLYLFLCSERVADYVRKQANTLMQPNLSITDLHNLPIPLPPLAKQRAIVGRLEALSAETRRLEEIYQQKVESLEELKKSVLGKAFAGEL